MKDSADKRNQNKSMIFLNFTWKNDFAEVSQNLDRHKSENNFVGPSK